MQESQVAGGEQGATMHHLATYKGETVASSVACLCLCPAPAIKKFPATGEMKNLSLGRRYFRTSWPAKTEHRYKLERGGDLMVV